MRRPQAILIQAQEAVGKFGSSRQVPAPTLTDTRLASKLVGVFARQLLGKPRLRGVEHLGWNATKTRFLTPCWQVEEAGLNSTAKMFHPRDEALPRWFTLQDYPLARDFSLVGPQGRYLIALVAASLTRAFLNLAVPTVPIMRSARSLVQAVFRPLGQIAPVELGSERQLTQTLLDQFSGYPLYTTAPEFGIPSSLNYPLFVLGETGVPLQDTLGSEVLAQVTNLSHQVLTSLVLALRRDPVHAHALVQRDSARLLQDLAKEGRRIIQTIAAVEQFELVGPEMPMLESLLSEASAAQASKYFRADQKGVIYIRCRNLPRVQRKALYQELFSKNQQVRLHGDHYLACPAEWFSKILEKLYGGPVDL
jgi:hypothetical protein